MVASLNSVTASGEPATEERATGLRHLPFAFAKRHGVLIQELRDGVVHAIYKTGAGA